MINSHQFQQAAKQFRAGRISLKEFTDLVLDGVSARKPNEQAKTKPAAASPDPSAGTKKTGLAPLPPRSVDSHKGDFGRVVAIGGSVGMAGAISLTGLAALRSGSGLVKVMVPRPIQLSVASFSPCLMTIGCPAEGDFFDADANDLIAQHADWADVIALGPGMGQADSLRAIVAQWYSQVAQPMVVDADGINLLAEGQVDLKHHVGERILTPHPGEFQRLVRSQITHREEMETVAKRLAGSTSSVIVLKGHRTYITDGSQEYRNDTGNPGMATAGAGDVLTGVISSLVGQGLSAFDAAALGVRVHGIAGDFAAEAIGETSMIATDVLEYLPAAFMKQANNHATPIGFLSN